MSENSDLKQDIVREKILSFIKLVKDNKNIVIQGSTAFLVGLLFVLYYNDSKQNTENEAKALLGQAQNLYIDSNIEDAIDEFYNVLNEYSGTEASNIAKLYLSIDYLNNNLNDDALLLLDELSISLNDEVLKSSVFNMIGNIYLDMNNLDDALRNFKKASNINTINSFDNEFLLNIAKTYKLMNKYDKSIEVLDKLINDDNIKYNIKNEAQQLEGEIKYLISNKTN